MLVSRLPGPFGVSIEGLDLSSEIDEATVRSLIDLLCESQLVLIRGQKLDETSYVRFGRHWGKPLEFFMGSMIRTEFPELVRLDNDPKTPERIRRGSWHWHSDSSFEEVPANVTMLYGVEAPEQGGETLFANTVLAYDALPEERKKQIRGLVGLHCLSGAPPLPDEEFAYVPEAIARLGIHRHPLAYPHPVTGHHALYTSGSAFGIEGMPSDKGRELIYELRAHCVDSRFVTSCRVGPGDLLIWDNLQTMHRATDIEFSNEEGKRRMLYRISAKGLPQLFQSRNAA